MLQYLIVFEGDRKGYLIGLFDDLEESIVCYEKAINLIEFTQESAHAFLKKFKSYVTRNEEYITSRIQKCATTGYSSVYLIEIGSYWKSVEHFIADREYKPKYPVGIDLRN